MSIKFIRIDDRLIHGQIVTAWAKVYNVSKIWIIDDGVAKDEFIKGIMKMVAPTDTELIITGTENILELVKKFDESEKNTLILVKVPEVAKQVFEAGVLLKELNIGGMGANSERKKLFKNISASSNELDTLQEIKNMGVKVYFQVTPNEKETLFEK